MNVKVKQQIAEHILLDAAGNAVDDFEQAHGIRYVDKASGQTIDYTPGNDGALRMLACFGARTLATNVASAARQQDATGAEQLEAIKERFELIDSGKWVDRTRDGGPRTDLPTLATAAVDFLVGIGKVQDNDTAKGEAYGKMLAKLEEDKAQVSKLLSVPEIATRYKTLRGSKTASAEDIAALVG